MRCWPCPLRPSARTAPTLPLSRCASGFNNTAAHPQVSISSPRGLIHAVRVCFFKKAFAGISRVGIISVISLDYDASRWWKYSAGVRNVIGEFLGYCYVVLFFNEANG